MFVVGAVSTRIFPIDIFEELVQCSLVVSNILLDLPTPSAPVLVSMVAISLANFAIVASDFDISANPMSSPQPPTAIMILALGYSERMVVMGTLGWKVAVALAMANARTT